MSVTKRFNRRSLRRTHKKRGTLRRMHKKRGSLRRTYKKGGKPLSREMSVIALLIAILSAAGVSYFNREKLLKNVNTFFKNLGISMPSDALKSIVKQCKIAIDPKKSKKEQQRALNAGEKKLNEVVKKKMNEAEKKANINEVDKKASEDKKKVARNADQKIRVVEATAEKKKKDVVKQKEREQSAIKNNL